MTGPTGTPTQRGTSTSEASDPEADPAGEPETDRSAGAESNSADSAGPNGSTPAVEADAEPSDPPADGATEGTPAVAAAAEEQRPGGEAAASAGDGTGGTDGATAGRTDGTGADDNARRPASRPLGPDDPTATLVLDPRVRAELAELAAEAVQEADGRAREVTAPDEGNAPDPEKAAEDRPVKPAEPAASATPSAPASAAPADTGAEPGVKPATGATRALVEPTQPAAAQPRQAGAPAKADEATPKSDEKSAPKQQPPGSRADTQSDKAPTSTAPADQPPPPSPKSGAATSIVEPAPGTRERAEASETTAIVPRVASLPSRSGGDDAAPVSLLDLRSTPARGWPRPPTGMLVAVGLVLLLGCALLVQTLRGVPEPTISLAARTQVLVPGRQPSLPWPSTGQAALEAQGIGNLGASGPEAAQPIASVTKVMTAYVILRDHPLGVDEQGPLITVDAAEASRYPARLSGSQSLIKVTAGATFTERQALEALMLPSADNMADVLARWDAGSIPAFAVKMNAVAASFGMRDTTYTGASGLDASTMSTAADLVKLGAKAMENPTFASIVAMPRTTLPLNGVVQNTNALLGQDGVIGIKTGYTSSAGGCLLFAAKRQVGGATVTIIGAVLGQRGAGSNPLAGALATSKSLIRASGSALERTTVLRAGTVVATVHGPFGATVPVTVARDVSLVALPGTVLPVKLTTGQLPGSAPAGTQVGSVTVGSGDRAQRVPVVLRDDLRGPSWSQRLTRLG